ncbi:MAG: gamma carbonic anhydrase family protein [Saprospiraceae bacterium]
MDISNRNIISIGGKTPQFALNCWIANNATITGDVVIGKQSSVWYQVVIRGDVNKIIIGDNVNIQDGAIVHGSDGKGDTIIGNNVSIGHRAIVHGCIIHDDVLIGMGAIVLDDVVIESNVIVAAGAVVTGGKRLESGYLYAGVPAKKLKKIDAEKADYYIKKTAQGYVEASKYYRENT